MSNYQDQDKELLRLIETALKLELENNVCVYIDLSGHVNWLDIRIATSERDYASLLGKWRLRYGNHYDGKKISVRTIRKNVNIIIKELNDLMDNLHDKREEALNKTQAQELETLARLQAKYGCLKDKEQND